MWSHHTITKKLRATRVKDNITFNQVWRPGIDAGKSADTKYIFGYGVGCISERVGMCCASHAASSANQ
jgi:hypothetical protein